MQFTVFSSILNNEMKKSIASEMLRILRMDGIILWYDLCWNNPRNPYLKGIKKKEIFGLFKNCRISLKKVTLAPPILRILAPHSWLLCYILEKFLIFNTSYFGLICKKI